MTITKQSTQGSVHYTADFDESPRTPAELVHHRMPVWKRVFDLIVAVLIIICVLPILVVVAAYIRIVSGSPVTFCQSRLGEMGEYFTIYKFRTLETSKEPTPEHRNYVASLQDSGAALEKPDFGDRLIPGGKFLRAHALDELPQLFNVLNGSMSLVGPRPEVLDWDDYPPRQRRRLEATPGMTGLWQVSGKNKLSFTEMVDLDLDYIQRRSPWLDLAILLKTAKVVIAAED